MSLYRALAMVCLALSAVPAYAAVSKEELEALQRERDAAVAENEIRAAKGARIGTITAELPKGSGEAIELAVEPKILAYSAVDLLAAAIVSEISSAVKKNKDERKDAAADSVAEKSSYSVVMFSARDLYAINQARALRKIMGQLYTSVKAFKLSTLPADNPPTCKVDTAAGAGEGAMLGPLGAIDLGLQVLSLFKTDKKLQGSDTTIDDAALMNAVIRQLLERGVTTARPDSFIASAMADEKDDAVANSPTLKALEDLADVTSTLERQLDLLASKRKRFKENAESKEKKSDACVTAYRAAPMVLDQLEAVGKSLKARADKVIVATSTLDDTGASLIQTLALADAFAKEFANAYVLQVKAVAAGGTINTETNFFHTSFWASGGAIATYQLLDGKTGLPVAAGNFSYYGGNVNLVNLRGSVVPAATSSEAP